MDDLPPSLTVMSPDELQNKVNQEQQDNTGASAILNAVELDSELAGDGEFLKEPGKNYSKTCLKLPLKKTKNWFSKPIIT